MYLIFIRNCIFFFYSLTTQLRLGRSISIFNIQHAWDLGKYSIFTRKKNVETENSHKTIDIFCEFITASRLSIISNI